MGLSTRHMSRPFSNGHTTESLGYLLIDTETTGFSTGKDRLIKIGIAWLDSSFRTAAEYTSLNQIETPVRATHVHGITDEMLNGANSFATTEKGISATAMTNILVGHNLPFDLRRTTNETSLRK